MFILILSFNVQYLCSPDTQTLHKERETVYSVHNAHYNNHCTVFEITKTRQIRIRPHTSNFASLRFESPKKLHFQQTLLAFSHSSPIQRCLSPIFVHLRASALRHHVRVLFLFPRILLQGIRQSVQYFNPIDYGFFLFAFQKKAACSKSSEEYFTKQNLDCVIHLIFK